MKNNKKRFNSGYNREMEVAKIAAELNLSYTQKDEFGLINLLKDFRLFKMGGRKRNISNIFGKKSDLHEVDLSIFDFEYTGFRTGKKGVQLASLDTYRQTVFFAQSKKLALPKFYMQPERLLHKVSTLLGRDDIDFEAFPEFSNQYWLKGRNEQAIRESMNENILRFFTIEKYWNLEAINYYLIFYSKNKVLFGDQLKMLYQKGSQILDMFTIK